MSDSHKKSDRQLVALSLENADYFAWLVDRYEVRLRRYVMRITHLSSDFADDVLQEIFIKVYRHLNDYDPDLKFSSWIYRIAHNESINYIKKHHKIKVLPLENDDEEVVSYIEVLKSEIDLPQELNRKQIKDLVHLVLSKLKPSYREALYLFYIESYSYAEISDILKCPMGTVATLVSRAKKSFRLAAEDLKYHLYL